MGVVYCTDYTFEVESVRILQTEDKIERKNIQFVKTVKQLLRHALDVFGRFGGHVWDMLRHDFHLCCLLFTNNNVRRKPLLAPSIACTGPNSMHGLEQYVLKNKYLDAFISMKTYRPQNLNIYVEFGIESDLLVEKKCFVGLDQVLFLKNVLYNIMLFYPFVGLALLIPFAGPITVFLFKEACPSSEDLGGIFGGYLEEIWRTFGCILEQNCKKLEGN